MVLPSIGEYLRDERENQGRTLKEISAKINIKEDYLAAIEDNDFDQIPGETFVKGFIRNYANYLGMDGVALVNEYKRSKSNDYLPYPEEATVDALPKKKRESTRSPKQSRLPRLTIIAGAILFLLLCLWLFL